MMFAAVVVRALEIANLLSQRISTRGLHETECGASVGSLSRNADTLIAAETRASCWTRPEEGVE